MAKLSYQCMPTNICYIVGVVPPRCRKVRIEERKETVDIPIREAEFSDLKLAFEVEPYVPGEKESTLIFMFDNQLYTRCTERDPDTNEYYGISRDDLAKRLSERVYGYYCCEEGKKGREGVLKYAAEKTEKYLLVDDDVYEKTGEPVYSIQTFGLRGDGTGMFAEYISFGTDPDSYFNALEGDEAEAYAKKVAARHGDATDSFRHLIKVIDPEMVKQPKHTEFIEMTTDDFMQYIQENFTVSGEALRLIANIVYYAQNNSGLYGKKLEDFLKTMLDNTIGIEEDFIHRVVFVNEREKQS